MCAFPALDLATWQPTRDTLNNYARIIGRIRRERTTPQKHWWHISLHATATGLTTTPIPAGDITFELLMDFTDHQLYLYTSKGDTMTIPFLGQSQAEFREETLNTLQELGVTIEIDKDLFTDDTPGTYDPAAVSRFWQAFVQIDSIFKTFKHGFRQESSPVQLWPHHFDLAVLWLSGRLVPGQDPDNEEYADEQMNFGFSTGDDTIPEPYFYATAYPTPANFSDAALPTGAYWHTAGWTGAILPYRLLPTAADPKATLLTFLRTAHAAGASHMQP